MLELLILGLAGMSFGVGLSARRYRAPRRHRVPRRIAAEWFGMSGVALVLAALTLPGNS